MKLFSISNPEIEFSFYHNNKIIRHYKSQSLNKRIIEIFGSEYNNNIIKVDTKIDDIHISGFIGYLSLLKKRQGNQFTFVR